MLPEMRGDIAGSIWPPLYSTRLATGVALVQQLDATQWLAAETIGAHQDRQLESLSRHFAAHVPAYRERLRAAGLDGRALDRAALADLPPLTRRDLQAGDALFCQALPPGHGPVGMAQTSGSTGEPVKVLKTMIGGLFWNAMTIRYHLWQEPDLLGRLCAIRASNLPAERLPSWGGATAELFATGPFLRINNDLDLRQQIDAVADFSPVSLMIYPSNLAAMLDQLEGENSTLPSVQRVRTIGETLSPGLRERTEAQLGATVRDCYSSEEVGYIAIECPAGGLYHVMAETVIVEIVDVDGHPCREGEIGRVLVTDLHNHATPLIRYAIGDMAEAGPPCSCGRGLPTLRRIVGRERNMLLTPDGRRAWPLTGFRDFATIAPVIQYQLIQHALDAIEVRLVVGDPLSTDQEQALTDLITRSLGYPFTLSFTYFADRIPRQANGKFEEYVNLVE